MNLFGSKRIGDLEIEVSRLRTNLRNESDAHHTEETALRNQIEYLVRTIRDMDEQIYKMSQCTDFYQMRPHATDLIESMSVRKRAESDRISELIRPELIKTYATDPLYDGRNPNHGRIGGLRNKGQES